MIPSTTPQNVIIRAELAIRAFITAGGTEIHGA
jgi:hypothetical protein